MLTPHMIEEYAHTSATLTCCRSASTAGWGCDRARSLTGPPSAWQCRERAFASLRALFVGDAFATYAATTGAGGPQVAPFTADAA
jgi:hypothetical protein